MMTQQDDVLQDAILQLALQPASDKALTVRRRLEAVLVHRCDDSEACRRCPVNCRLTLCAAA